MDYRQLSRFLAAGRIVVGLAALVVPAAGLRSLGADATGGAKLITRAFGGRELVLAAGTLRALDNDATGDHWVRAGAAADVVDAVATIMAIRALGWPRAIGLASVAGAAAATGFRAADRLE